MDGSSHDPVGIRLGHSSFSNGMRRCGGMLSVAEGFSKKLLLSYPRVILSLGRLEGHVGLQKIIIATPSVLPSDAGNLLGDVADIVGEKPEFNVQAGIPSGIQRVEILPSSALPEGGLLVRADGEARALHISQRYFQEGRIDDLIEALYSLSRFSGAIPVTPFDDLAARWRSPIFHTDEDPGRRTSEANYVARTFQNFDADLREATRQGGNLFSHPLLGRILTQAEHLRLFQSVGEGPGEIDRVLEGVEKLKRDQCMPFLNGAAEVFRALLDRYMESVSKLPKIKLSIPLELIFMRDDLSSLQSFARAGLSHRDFEDHRMHLYQTDALFISQILAQGHEHDLVSLLDLRQADIPSSVPLGGWWYLNRAARAKEDALIRKLVDPWIQDG